MTVPRSAADLRLPEKPALEGLEAKWGARWEADGTYRFDRSKPRDRDLLDRHAAARPSAVRCTSATSSRTRTPTSSRASSGCAAGGLLSRWGGTTTACRPSVACRTTSACAAIRRCRTIRPSRRPTTPAKHADPVSRPNFIELCERLTAEDEKAFEALCGGASGLSVDWSHDVHDRSASAAARVAARVPPSAASRPRLPARGPDAVGHRLPHGRRAGGARGPRDRRRLSPHPRSRGATATASRDRDARAGADPRVRGAGGAP